MVGLAYASVPLYRLFCQVTGYGGTTQQAARAPGALSGPAGERLITVRFNADTSSKLPWLFKPSQKEVSVKLGEQALAFFEATNRSKEGTSGSAVFNVTPLKAGKYFNKIACFCFDEQHLEPGQAVDMPVTFFIDPEMVKDPNLDDVDTITLSYTFFRATSAQEGNPVQLSRATAGPGGL